eukprot:Trichotokara_eunicae@DN5762_c0_g1_i3.p1
MEADLWSAVKDGIWSAVTSGGRETLLDVVKGIFDNKSSFANGLRALPVIASSLHYKEYRQKVMEAIFQDAPKHKTSDASQAYRALKCATSAYKAEGSAGQFLTLAFGGKEEEDLVHKEEITRNVASVSGCEVYFVTEKSKPLCPAHCILLNKSENEVVVSIRGTHRMEDLLTDILCDDSKVRHVGIDKSAQTLVVELTPKLTELKKLHPEMQTLLITGHSLGAGTASLLTMYWNTNNKK